MGKLYGSSAPLSQTFTFNGNAPIDDRIAVKSIDDLQSINAYKGLFVFVEDENEYYSYTLNNIYEYEWQKAQFGSSGEVTGAVYETLLALQAEVAKLRNSFLYGITSYQGEDTAASRVVEGLREVDDKEPLWAIDEDDLSILEDLKDDLNSKTIIKPLDGTKLDVTVDGVLGIEKAVWEDEVDILKSDRASKHILYMASSSDDIQIEYGNILNNSTNLISLKDLTGDVKVDSYHYMIITSRMLDHKGYRYVYISIDNNRDGSNIVHGYYNNGKLQTQPSYVEDDMYISKIYFNNLQLSKLNFYVKAQDFSNEVIPSAPKEQDYKYMAAHLTIREVANDEQLEKIKLQLLQPELVWIANTHELKINTKDGLYTIGASKGSTPDTEETMANIKEALQDMGIIYNDASKSISLAKVEDVTFVRSDNQQYKVAVDSDGNLCTELQSTGQLKTLVDKAKTKIKEFPKAADGVTELFTNKSVKAFSAKILYTIKALTCPLPDDGREDNEENHIEYWKSTHTAKISADWGLYADRIKIGSIYVKGNIANNACGCSHAYIELENTSDEDFPIDGCKMFFINGDTVISKEVYGVIPAGSTFLIRGKKYRDYEECIIKVKTYDIEWPEFDTTSADLTGNIGLMFVYNEGLTLTNGFPTGMVAACVDQNDQWNLNDTTTYPYVYDYRYIDSMIVNVAAGNNVFSPYKVSATATTTAHNSIIKNTFELDPAKQAFQGLTAKDSSRIRNAKAQDIQIVNLAAKQIVFDKSFIIRNVDIYTPKASFEKKNIITDKTQPDTIKPNAVTCSFGINIHTTRCFNWVSLNESNEFVFIKNGNKWERFESYGGNNHDIPGVFKKKKLATATENEAKANAENIIYSRLKGTFPGTNYKYVVHKCIIYCDNAVSTPTTYTYVVGRAGADGNPDMQFCSEEQTFTLYPTTYVPRIYQTSDQQGFHWIEYQVWAAAAIELNKKIEDDCAKEQIIPVLVNTGDMTQNGTRINEWLDYYNGGKCLFTHLEQMNVVGNNDLCNADHSILGTGDDNGKINPYFFHVFYCYEQPDPEKFIFNNIYVPSIYYFGNTKYKFLMMNSEVAYGTCEQMYSPGTVVNIYTGYTISTSADFEQTYVYEQPGTPTPIYETLYKWFNTNNSGVTWVVACHEMPFTVITHPNLKTINQGISRSIDGAKKSLVGSHLNQINANDIKGSYWFSRLLEYFNVKLCIGGHKHTYVCTFPLRENFKWIDNEGVAHHSTDEQYTMPASLKDDINITWKDSTEANNLYNSTKLPLYYDYINMLPPEEKDTAEVVRTLSESGATIFRPLLGTKGSKGTPASELNHVTYLMCQATGYKVKSNKELPSSYQFFSKVVAGTSTASAQKSQLYPMYVIVEFDGTDIKAKLVRIGNIFKINETKGTESFGQNAVNTKPVTIEYLSGSDLRTMQVESNTTTAEKTRWKTKKQIEESSGSLTEYVYDSTFKPTSNG